MSDTPLTPVDQLKELKVYLKDHDIKLPKEITDEDLHDIIETTEPLRKRLEQRKEKSRNDGKSISKPDGAKPHGDVSKQPVQKVSKSKNNQNFGRGI